MGCLTLSQRCGEAKEGCAAGGPTKQPRPPGPELISGRETSQGGQRGAPWWWWRPTAGRWGEVWTGGPVEAPPAGCRRQSGETLSRFCWVRRPEERTADCNTSDLAARTERQSGLSERSCFAGGHWETCAEEEHNGSGGALGQSSERGPTQEVSSKSHSHFERLSTNAAWGRA